jgi:hypothetical protein
MSGVTDVERDLRWRMERAARVPTATEGRRGVKRKKFFGLMMI